VKASPKLSGEERRAAIVQAVRRVFADKGFHGTTTRELAQAAGVSEALLFKHFPNKEALYSAMLQACCGQEKDPGLVERLKALEPSASTLVILLHLWASHMLGERTPGDDENVQHRLMLRSLLEDGEFARFFLQRVSSRWIGKLEECLKAAVAAGDAVEGPVEPRLAGWFAEHVVITIMIRLRPAAPIVDYGVPRKKLVEQAVWFVLRGMGLKEEAIKRCYNPQALGLFAR
jgi:AcrR family transcriptional regulator